MDGDHAALGAVILELHASVDLGKERVIFPETDIQSWTEPSSPLAHEYRTAGDDVAVEPLDAETLGVAVPAVA